MSRVVLRLLDATLLLHFSSPGEMSFLRRTNVSQCSISVWLNGWIFGWFVRTTRDPLPVEKAHSVINIERYDQCDLGDP